MRKICSFSFADSTRRDIGFAKSEWGRKFPEDQVTGEAVNEPATQSDSDGHFASFLRQSLQCWRSRVPHLFALLALAALTALGSNTALASLAFGDLNNFDVFNDTGQQTHGFEIELDDIRSINITYTYDYNHYGTPKISEDNTDPLHPKVFVRYAAGYDPTTQNFSAYTAVPAAPPAPTAGHQCTDPSVNFGCEHFGVGFSSAPTVVRYNWLIEDSSVPGNLIHGPAVNVSTPTFVYFPPIPLVQPVAQVQAIIEAPPPPEVPVFEFGDAVWVKEIRTTTHNNAPVELRDLVSDDPADPADKNWTNGEPDEVEVEWQIQQTEFANANGANNELVGANEDLPNGDEVITRRYEFYKYTGPLDPETNEILCEKYPAISDSADPLYKAECDPSTVTILGDYIGAQMAGFDVAAVLGLIDNIQDGDLNQPYTSRTVVVGGNTPYATTVPVGSLPAGLSLDPATGVLSGTPTAAGSFSFTVNANDADAVQVSKAYTMRVLDPSVVNPTQFQLSVAKTGSGTGSVLGTGGINCGVACTAQLDSGTSVSLTATPNANNVFEGWSGACTGTGTCDFTLSANTSVTASFGPQQFQLSVAKSGVGSGTVTGNGIDCGTTCSASLIVDTAVSLTATPAAGSVFTGWSGACTGTGTCDFTLSGNTSVTATFGPQQFQLSVAKSGAGSGTVTGSGINCGTTCSANLAAGTVVSLTATPTTGSVFSGWSGDCAGTGVCSFTMTAARNVVATFVPLTYKLTVVLSGPANGGTVVSSPSGISCGTDCQESYNPGTRVTLSATAARHRKFVGWSGACTKKPCRVTMDRDQSVTAIFR